VTIVLPAPVLRYVPWVVAGLSLATLAVAAVAGLTVDPALGVQRLASSDFGWWIGSATFSVVGALVATRRPENPVGWLMLAAGAINSVAQGAAQYAVWGLIRHPGSVPGAEIAAWLITFLWVLVITVLATMITVFPNGRLVSRRWRWLPYLIAAVTVTLVGVIAVDMWHRRGARLLTSDEGYEQHTLSGLVLGVLWPVVLGCAIAAMVSIVVRYRRSRGVERQQLKWLMFAAVVTAPLIVVGEIVPQDSGWWAVVQVLNSPALFGVAAAIAILRYRLYDIDRILSRTVSYAVVTGVVVGLYLGAVALAERVLSFSSSLAVAASTLTVAAVFQPLRRRVQDLVDRRFDRAAYDAKETVDAFSARLRDKVDVDEVRRDLLAAVSLAVAPETASVWVPQRSPDAVR
jgi:hypothetical protein